MSDNHAVPALRAYDSTLISAPKLDRLADEGARFDSSSTTNSICTPGRAVIVTGKPGKLGAPAHQVPAIRSQDCSGRSSSPR